MKHLILIVILAGALCSCHYDEASSIQYDQPWVSALMKWDSCIVYRVEGDSRYMVLDPDDGTISELSTPDSSSFVVLSVPQSQKAAMLCSRDREEYLWIHETTGWRKYSIPKNFGFGDSCVLVTDHRRALIVEHVQEEGEWNDYISILDLERGTWSIRRKVAWRRGLFPWERAGNGCQYLLQDSILYVGINEGEWGGALLGVNLHTMQYIRRPEDPEDLARWREHHGEPPDTLTPRLVSNCVQSLSRDCRGTIWVSVGFAHMMAKSGSIYTGSGIHWTCFAGSYSLPFQDRGTYSPREWEQGQGENWTGKWCRFRQVTLDEYGVPYLITSYPQYVRAYREGKWQDVLPQWIVTEVGVVSILVQHDCMYLATSHAGVLIWDMRKRNLRQFLLPKPEYKLY